MKLFTLEEATALLPFLRESLKSIALELKAIRSLSPEVRGAQEQSHQGGGSVSGPAFVQHVLKFQHFARQIQSTGVHVKDFDLGLCDFPFDRHGQVVYLCWKVGEDRIDWWHDIESGFAGRQPLD